MDFVTHGVCKGGVNWKPEKLVNDLKRRYKKNQAVAGGAECPSATCFCNKIVIISNFPFNLYCRLK
jgi:hypothetical protein